MAFDILQIIIAGVLVAVILMQARGSGLSAAFGGEGNIYRTKRGFEKYLFIFTIIMAVIFLGTALFSALKS